MPWEEVVTDGAEDLGSRISDARWPIRGEWGDSKAQLGVREPMSDRREGSMSGMRGCRGLGWEV